LTLPELLEPVAADLARVETELIEQARGFEAGISDYVRYVLGSSGKRLRPTLALLAGGATGRLGDEHIKLAVIVELIHIATLVHDDVLDAAQLRRRQATANARWDNQLSVLLGDCLFAHALRLAASFPTTDVSRRISAAAGRVCAGELLQTKRRFDANLDLAQYLDIVTMKTGALFAVSCELGAALNEAPPAVVKAAREYGANFGIAYQVYDDCVDVFGREREAGKSLGTDVKQGKLTLPFLLMIQAADADGRQELAARIFSNDPREHRELLALARSNGVLPKSLATIEKFLAQADTNLRALPDGVHTQALAALSGYVSQSSRSLLKEAVIT
jgi:octaprenyl-diphosphate synthase